MGGFGGLFDTRAFRVLLQFGGERPAAAVVGHGGIGTGEMLHTLQRPRWIENWPASQPQELRFGRSVSDDGRYSSQFTCDVDEAIDMSCSLSSTPPTDLSADVWQERRTAIGKFDRVLSHI